MLKRDELTNPNSCMSRAKDDEMTFVLLGRDVAAPAAIRAWASEHIRLGKNNHDDAQILEAIECARGMDYGRPAASLNQMLQWEEEEHDDYNTSWQAQSPCHDGDGSHFMFCLIPVLRNNAVWWASTSEAECGGDLDGPWRTLDEAKDACEDARKTILQELEP